MFMFLTLKQRNHNSTASPHPIRGFDRGFDRGFTLIEMLVALAISSMILLTLYSVLNQTIVSKRVVDASSAEILKQVRLTEIINTDFRQGYRNSFKIENITIENNQEVSAFTFKTQNSLFFNNALKVSVSYYLHPSGWFVRVEQEDAMHYYNAFPLLPDIQSVVPRSYDLANSTYTETFNNKSDLFNFVITMTDNSSFNVTVPSVMLNR